ncbi:PilZ domain-containing protein [Oryzomonas sp.]|uniref:PilZ domain-containing protein n=1 Tax=Oryzomonas sp. TaxID=2855186 RepID=UPI0038D4B7CF
MRNQRLNIRLKYEWQCNVHLENSSCYAMTKNISSSGVLVHLLDPLSDIYVGDRCILSLKRGLLLRYDSEVVRVEASNIAFRLLSTAM